MKEELHKKPLTPEQLMQPRYKVIADFPHSSMWVGMIFIPEKKEIKFYDKYPHLFKRLEWWEDRKIEDMPAYLKFDDERLSITSYGNDVEPEIHKVKNHWYKICSSFMSEWRNVDYSYRAFMPATEQEYNTYIQSQKD